METGQIRETIKDFLEWLYSQKAYAVCHYALHRDPEGGHTEDWQHQELADLGWLIDAYLRERYGE